MRKFLSFFKRRIHRPFKALYTPISADFDEKGTHRLVSEVPPSTGHTSGAHGHDTTTTMQETVLNTFVFALALLEKLTECAPVPGLKGAVGIFHVVMQRFEGAEQNMDDMEELVKAVDAFNNILSKFEDSSGTGRGLSDDLGEQLFMLSRELTAIKSQALVISRHSRFRRMIESQHDAHVITSGFRRLQGLIHVILVGSALKTEARLADLWALEHLDKLPRAKDARYDYVDLPLCSEGTREGVLNQIMSWAKDKDAHQIYWLNGGAGTGKTTIALTIASMLAKDTSIFSASFFCSRSSESRSDSRLIFPTFSYLFARCDVKLRNRIVRVIRQMPDVGHALPGEQLMKLLVDPLRREYDGSQRPVVLILDALDECAGGRAPEIILTALASVIQLVPFLKVFVSSRPTASTNDAFSNRTLREHREVFVLHDVEDDVVDADIRDYMMERLSRKAVVRQLSIHPWPPPELVKVLVKMAGGLFIFASTVCEFIEARGDLDFRLKEITDRPLIEYTGIDGLYREILEYAISQFPDKTTLDHCRSIITTIILLQDPLSSCDLGQLLRLPPKHIQGILGDLQSVLTVPDAPDGVIRTLHASFSDFISTKARCLPSLYVDPAPQHRSIVRRLFEIMETSLKQNMAYYILFKLNKNDYFPGSLRYACRFWADHLSRTDSCDASELLVPFTRFVSKYLLHCLEVLDSVSKPSEDLSDVTIDKAMNWLAIMPRAPSYVTSSLNKIYLSLNPVAPGQNLFGLFGLPETRYAYRGYGRMCCDGTRNDVLERILHWANEPAEPQLLWLNGAAGMGKTTVAMTVANLMEMDRSKLSATFFCSRYSKYRRNIHNLFVTLAIILASRNSLYRQQLVNAIGRNPLVIHAPLRDQFRILIIEPLRLGGLLNQQIIFVIDALDECRPLAEDAPAKVINAFSKHLHELPSLKVLISTRPSPFLYKEMNNTSWVSRPAKLHLHDVERSSVDADIRRYLFEVLCTHASIVERLSPSWPPDELLDKLVAKAGGHFLYASFIGQRFTLVGAQKIIEASDQQGSEYEGHLGLNLFYGRMLRWLIGGDDLKAEQYRLILGILAHLYASPTLQQFQFLLGIPANDLGLRLLELQPIVIAYGDKRLLRPIHESIRHWLSDKERALPALFVEEAEAHQMIISRLLNCMVSVLQRNTSGPEAGEEVLLDYACRFWAEHLMKTVPTPTLQRELEDFLQTKLGLWIERLDESGSLMVAAAALENARMWYHKVSQPHHECVKAFADAQKRLIECSMMHSTANGKLTFRHD